jgi:hypothetical protein
MFRPEAGYGEMLVGDAVRGDLVRRLALLSDVTFALLTLFIILGLVERVGFAFIWRRSDAPAGRLPGGRAHPCVCTQLPMYNERAVAQRAIDAACGLDWPSDRHEVMVLDDSTDAEVREIVDAAAAGWRARGVRCSVIRRTERNGYKAGALEAGRKRTGAEFIAMFDADFVPPVDFLQRMLPRFYSSEGEGHADLALVQAQWSHLNLADSLLTLAQSLWIDDHHVSQMGWRSRTWGFVNFTGTAGVWRAEAIERAGGWRACSLVEDCELSFRILFCGYRTAFAHIDVPSELPTTMTAYKAQQRRWTVGWAQLLRLHLGTLLFRYECGALKRAHLCYHMCVSLQWPLWLLWQMLAPWLIDCPVASTGAARGGVTSLLLFTPLLLHLLISTTIAAVARCDSYEALAGLPRPLRCLALCLRVLPTSLLSASMLPHQACSWFEGLFSGADAEFETTPKNGSVGRLRRPSAAMASGRQLATPAPGQGMAHGMKEEGKWVGTAVGAPASVSAPSVQAARVPWCTLAELGFVAYQLAWLVHFVRAGKPDAVGGIAFSAAAVLGGLCCMCADLRRSSRPASPSMGPGSCVGLGAGAAADPLRSCRVPLLASPSNV